MACTDATSSTDTPGAGTIDMKLEAVAVPVWTSTLVEGLYESLGWRLDADIAVGDSFRIVQLTPPQLGVLDPSSASASPRASPAPSSACCSPSTSINEARADLVRRGSSTSASCSTWPWRPGARPGPAGPLLPDVRVVQRPGRKRVAAPAAPAAAGWEWEDLTSTIASPGLVRRRRRPSITIPTRSSHAPHNWWDWYAAYMDGREKGPHARRGGGGRGARTRGRGHIGVLVAAAGDRSGGQQRSCPPRVPAEIPAPGPGLPGTVSTSPPSASRSWRTGPSAPSPGPGVRANSHGGA